MSILAWIEDQRKLKLLNAPKYNHPASDGSKGLWTRCDHCGVILYIKHLKENQRVCFGCGYHLQMESQERIDHLIDENTWRPLDETLSPCDPLEFRDQKPYTERLKDAQEKTGLQDAIQTGTGMLDGIPIALGVMDFHFMGGSMGSVVGEKITRLIEYATQEGLTLVLVCASGGARMQEGIFSLMQMAKISSALQIYQSCANLLYISVLTSPTTGGVTASFAMLGDLIFAEPKALIGFAGRRVIEQTLQEDLPDDFQTSEYLLHHGLLDLIVPRCFLKQALSETITLYKDAPFKRIGSIPYGIQNSLYFLTEEKARRKWHQWTSSINNVDNSWSFASTGDRQLEKTDSHAHQLLDACISFAQPFIETPNPSMHYLQGNALHAMHGTLNSSSGTPLGQSPSSGTPNPCEACPREAFAPNKHPLSSLNNIHFKATLDAWLKDSSRDAPYREILVSFQTMFSLFAAGSSFGTLLPSSEASETNEPQVLSTTQQSQASRDDGPRDYLQAGHDQSTQADDLSITTGLLNTSQAVDQYERGVVTDKGMVQVNTGFVGRASQSDATSSGTPNPCETFDGLASQSDARPSRGHPSYRSPLLEVALGIGAAEVVAWRAFYTNEKLSPKVTFLEDLEPVNQIDDASKTGIYKKEEAEKKFFYQMILNNSRV